MNPTNEGSQSNESQGRQSSISQGINTINSFARGGFPNPLRRTGFGTGRMVAQAGARSIGAFLISPTGLVIIAIAATIIITLAIILPLGAPPPAKTNTPTNTVTPTQTAP